MANYHSKIYWERNEKEVFIDQKFSRSHQWGFTSGTTIPASASVHIVAEPYANPNYLDPEEAFVASLASCHMLFFLSIAAKRGFIVNTYCDDAEGTLGKNEDNKIAMTTITLRPIVEFGTNKQPTLDQFNKMHQQSHLQCFIANSVCTQVTIKPTIQKIS